MTKEELEFRFYLRRHNIKEIDEDVVNDFMFEYSVYGEEMFNILISVKL